MKSLLVLVAAVAPLAGQTETVTLCHVPPGNPDNAQTISTANPSAHIDPLTGQGVKGHELDFLGPCEGEDPPPGPGGDQDPPPNGEDPPPPPAADNPRGQGHSRRTTAKAKLISCVVFPALWFEPQILSSNLSDEGGYILLRALTPDLDQTDRIDLAARARADYTPPAPLFDGFVVVKAYGADIRSVAEHERPGKGLTREHGLPCWEGSDVPVYGPHGLLKRRDWWPW